MNKEYKGFKEGNRYLVKDDSKYWDTSFKLIEIIILEITEKAIKIKPVNNNTKWYLKESFNFSIIEELINPIEKNSKLEWEQNPPKEEMNWNDANNYAKSLGECWRLPTKVELVDAYDNYYKGFKKAIYWSSSTYARDTNGAWVVSFYSGIVACHGKTGGNYVRCVREIKNA